MASRKEEKERLRREREAAEKQSSSSERKRLLAGYALAGLISAAVLAGIVFAVVGSSSGGSSGDQEGFGDSFGTVPKDAELDGREGVDIPAVTNVELAAAAEEGGCELQLDLESDGNEHFTNLEREVKASTNPPASGDHYAANEPGSGALATGPYLNTPPLSRAVHSLEHGRIAIEYSPDLPEEQQLQLKGIYDANEVGTILFPNPDLDDDVAVAAWTQLLTCKDFDGSVEQLDAIRNFRNDFIDRGPERIPF